MAALNYEEMRQMLESYSATGDPEDPRERKRLRIIQAATELFIRQGYRKTSMDEVARQAGVAKGTLYLYVKTKAELMVLAIVEEKKRFMGEIRHVLAPDITPRQRLRRYMRTVLVMASEMPLVSKVMSGDREILAVLAEAPEAMGDQHEQMRKQMLNQMVEEAARPHSYTSSEIEDRADMIYGLMFFSPVMADPRVRMGLSLERFAELLANMVVDGLTNPQPLEQRSVRGTIRGDL